MPPWKLVVAILLATCGCVMLALRWPGSVFLFLALPLLLNHKSWADLKRSHTTPIPKEWRTLAIVTTVVFVLFMLWQAFFMPGELHRVLDDAATSLFAVGAIWVLLAGAILYKWLRAKRAQQSDGA
jgi:hypothetical protein